MSLHELFAMLDLSRRIRALAAGRGDTDMFDLADRCFDVFTRAIEDAAQ